MTISEKSVIFYFSATGNSLKVADDIGRAISAETIDIAPLMDQESVTVASEAIGFVFPVYDFKPPKIVKDFLNKLSGFENSYIYAICTYGISPLKTLETFKTDLEQAGGQLSYGISVLLPDNGIGSEAFSEKSHQKMFAHWEDEKSEIANQIKKHQRNQIDKKGLWDLLRVFLLQGVLFKMIPTFARLLTKVVFRGWNSLAYAADEKCNNCGVCEKICPVHNIQLKNGKPVWGNQCINCFACLHWCPQRAISLGKTNLNIKHYHHPDVTLADILKKRHQFKSEKKVLDDV